MPVSIAADPPAKLPPIKRLAEYADPKTTYRTYIDAVRKNDAKAARECWVLDDDKESAALNVIVGLWTSIRQLNQVAAKKFGKEAAEAIPEGWQRGDLTDQALDLTKKRLDDAEVKITGATAELKIKWRKDDGFPDWAFEFGVSTVFRHVAGNWKIDGNQMTGLKKGSDFFEKGTWGRMFRDQMAIMNEAVAGVEKRKIGSAKALKTFINEKTAAMVKKYEKDAAKSQP